MRRGLLFAMLCWLGTLATLDIFGATGLIDQTNDAPPVLTLPAKPQALKTVASLGQPQVHFSAHLEKMFDADALGSQMGAELGTILNNSGRFGLTEDEHPQYRCKILVNNLEIQQTQSGATNGLAKLGSFFQKLKPGGSLSMLTNVNLAQADLFLTVKCTVQMEFFNEATKFLVASATGMVDEKGSTKAVALQVAGVSLLKQNLPGSQSEMPTNTFDLQCRIMETAAFRALTNLMPSLDECLLHAPAMVGTAEQTEHMPGRNASQEHVSTGSKAAAVCPYCGKPITDSDKFCPNCGKPILHFCPQCGKPVKIGDKFCPNCGKPLTQR
jgi:hypothetical protein